MIIKIFLILIIYLFYNINMSNSDILNTCVIIIRILSRVKTYAQIYLIFHILVHTQKDEINR